MRRVQARMTGLKLDFAVRERWPPVTMIGTPGRVHVDGDFLSDDGLFHAKPYPPDGIVTAYNAIAAEMRG